MYRINLAHYVLGNIYIHNVTILAPSPTDTDEATGQETYLLFLYPYNLHSKSLIWVCVSIDGVFIGCWI
jgi:hypothetical protein